MDDRSALELSIRRIRPADSGLLQQLRGQALREAPLAFGETIGVHEARPPLYFVQAAVRQALSGYSTTFFVHRGRLPVGMIGAYVGSESSARGYVCALWVGSGYRRMGAGGLLVNTAGDWLFDAGVLELCAWIAPGNTQAVGFYERMGFTAGSVIEPAPPPPSANDRVFARQCPATWPPGSW